MIEILLGGGPIMLPLLILSLISWFIFFERVLFIRKRKTSFEKLKEKILSHIKSEGIGNLEGELKGAEPLFSLIYYQMIDSKDENFEVQSELLERNLSSCMNRFRSSLWILGTISTISPFVGLFGTVFGIIKSFKAISLAGKGGFAVVASDLGEALIATAAGILVAIISVIFFNYFQNKIKDLSIHFRSSLNEVLLLMRK